MKNTLFGGVLLLLTVTCAHAESLTVDGRADEAQWAQATAINDLRLTQPETGAAPPFETRVRWLAGPEGIAFFFENDQDQAQFPRRAPRQARDNLGGSDRVNVMLDFDGTGKLGYNMTVSRSNSIEDSTISNENLFSSDWDGIWYHAVRERDGGWDAEILIPWASVLMRETANAKRTLGLYVDRVIGMNEQRAAYPQAIFNRPTFLSDFAPIEAPAFSASLLRWYPYTSVQADLVGSSQTFRTGLDVFWKPSGSLQLTAAINPDFGQVEADDLVVNFDAIEVFFSDRRPFFTENQGAFVIQSPEEEPLIYTRRVGGSRDDGAGISDIDLALKVSGSGYGLDYGVFAVRESDAAEVGKTFAAFRVSRPSERLDIGAISSLTERPFRDRSARVSGVDGEWRVSDKITLRGALLGSHITERDQLREGYGGWATSFFRFSPDAELRLDLTRYDTEFDFNDLGFQRRNNLRLWELKQTYRQNEFAPGSMLRSISWTLDIDLPEDNAGRRLRSDVSASSFVGFNNGGGAFAEIAKRVAGPDDLISRGNGVLYVGGGVGLYANYESPRIGNVRFFAESYLERDGLKDRLLNVGANVRYFFSDDFSARILLEASRFENRTLWRRENLFGRFARSEALSPGLDFEWFLGSSHELRLKMQNLGVSARDASALRLGANERLSASPDVVNDFAISNFGVQLRYRYKINQESDLFLVYGRGGDTFEPRYERSFDLISDAFSLRDTDQILLKLRYAF